MNNDIQIWFDNTVDRGFYGELIMAAPVDTKVYSPLYPEWINEEEIEYDNDFLEIIKFFLLHSICEGQSWKHESLHETYMWKAYPWNPQAYLKNKIFNAIWGNQTPKLYMAEKREKYKAKIQGHSLDADFYTNVHMQRAGYVKTKTGKGNDNLIMSLLYHIRNGFAHGRYGSVQIDDNDYMIFLEDGKEKNGQFEVTARIALKKSSLLAIKNVIMAGPDEDPDFAEEIMDSISRGNKTKATIMKDIDIDENIWKREITKLKNTGRIAYKNKKWIATIPVSEIA